MVDAVDDDDDPMMHVYFQMNFIVSVDKSMVNFEHYMVFAVVVALTVREPPNFLFFTFSKYLRIPPGYLFYFKNVYFILKMCVLF